MRLSDNDYHRIIDARLARAGAFRDALRNRARRDELTRDGYLLIVAADHPARGGLAVGGEPLAMADRSELLGRLSRVLDHPRVDGVLGSADILEELAFLDLLDDKIAVGTMNRGGLAGARWELDDRFTAFDVEHLLQAGLDAGKMLLRIDDNDPGTAATLEACAHAITALADAGLPAMVEPLPYTKDESGRAVILRDDAALIRATAIASGLGGTSSHTWLKIPAGQAPERVLPTTTMPTLILGGDAGPDPTATYDGWRRALEWPTARGLVVGRALLFPTDGDIDTAVDTAVNIVDEAVKRNASAAATS